MSLLKRIEDGQETGAPPSRLEELRVRRAPAAPARDTFIDLKERIQDKLIAELDPQMDISQTDEVRRTIEEMYDQILVHEGTILTRQRSGVGGNGPLPRFKTTDLDGDDRFTAAADRLQG